MVTTAADGIAALKARVAAAIGGGQKGGLNVGLHPALEDIGPGKAITKAKTGPTDTRSNPYLDGNAAGPAAHGAATKARPSRSLAFNQKGKYIRKLELTRQPQQVTLLTCSYRAG